jgi:ribosome biogenesis protein ERB1
LSWHPKGDYLATMQSNIQSTGQVLIHAISKASTQRPFSTTNGIIHAIAFHPTKPHFFAST